MYEIQKDQSVPVKFFAGEYPVVTAVKAVAAGKSVKQYEPVKLTDNGIEPVVKVAASEAVGLDLYQYNEWYLDNWTNPNAPAQKPLVPDGTLALLSTEAEYSIYYGAITMIPEEGKTILGAKYGIARRVLLRRLYAVRAETCSIPK